jgi:hypothetical protein
VVYKNGSEGMYANLYVNYQPVITKLAIILGVSFGALVGAIIGLAAKPRTGREKEGRAGFSSEQ